MRRPLDQLHPVVQDFARWRQRAGLSYEALAQLTGLGASTIRAYESGTRSPTLEKLELWARGLNRTVTTASQVRHNLRTVRNQWNAQHGLRGARRVPQREPGPGDAAA